MKDLKELNEDLNSSMIELQGIINSGAKGKRATVVRIQLIRDAIKYVEFNPDPKSIQRQFKEVSYKLEYIEDNFDLWKKNTPSVGQKKITKQDYYKEMDRNKYTEEYRFLDYLLS